MTAVAYHLEKDNRTVNLTTVRELLEEGKFAELVRPGPGNLRSAGWVDYNDIHGTDNLVLEAGEFLVFLYRIDEVKVSRTQAKLVAQKRIAAAARENERPLTKLAKRDIYEDVIDEMARGSYPVIKLVEVAWDTLYNRLYIFSTARGTQDELLEAVAPIVGVSPVQTFPYVVAQHCLGEGKADELIEAGGGDPDGDFPSKVEASRPWWSQFLLWTAYCLRDQEFVKVEGVGIEVYFEDKAVFGSLYDQSLITIQCDDPFSCPTGMTALKEQRVPVAAKMTMLAEVDKFPRRWKFTFDCDKNILSGVRVPRYTFEEFEEIISERLGALTALHNTLQKMFKVFLTLKGDEKGWEKHLAEVKRWLSIEDGE